MWYDRAAYHFLTDPKEVSLYTRSEEMAIEKAGLLLMGIFSTNSPLKCSGIPVQQYSDESLKHQFSDTFEAINTFTIDHQTPFSTTQNFVFGRFKKIGTKSVVGDFG